MEQCVLYIAGQERATLFSLSPCTVFCIIQQWARRGAKKKKTGLFSLPLLANRSGLPQNEK